MYTLFLSPNGRIGRRKFWIGFLGLSVFIFLVNSYLRAYPELYVSFWVALIFPFIAVHIIYSVFGKRLHDMGKSFWPLTAMIVLEIMVVIGIMLAFGGAEYFSEFSQYDRKAVIDVDVRDKLITDYQAQITANMGIIKPLMLIVPTLFTLWVGVSKGQDTSNKYGPL